MLEINESNFADSLKNKTLVVDFYATWCGPCRSLTPIFTSWAEKYEESAVFAKINVDEAQQIAKDMNISSIPCIIVFKEGVETKRFVGIPYENELAAQLS